MDPFNPKALVAGLALSILTGIALASCSLPGSPVSQTLPADRSVHRTLTKLPGAIPQATREPTPTAIPPAPRKPTPVTAAVPTTIQEGVAPTSVPAFIEPGVYSSLERGYYILYDDMGSIHALSMDGKVDRVLTTHWDRRMEVIGYDGKRLAVYQNQGNRIIVYNVEDDSTESVEYPEDCRPFQISTNLEWQSMICAEWKEIQIRSLVDTQRLPLKIANRMEGQTYHSLSWAPENNWLAALLREEATGDAKGLERWVFFDTSCLDRADTCAFEAIGPFQPGAESVAWQYWARWAPDGGRFAFPSHTGFPPVWTFDIATRTFSTIPAISSDTTKGTIQGLAVSPDGKTVAYTQHGRIYLAPASGVGAAVKIKDEGAADKVVIGWLSTYPSPVFKIGSQLMVSGAGETLNMRQSPSKGASVIHLLHTGDRVALVEGPVEADGARWWKVKTSEGVEGWSMENDRWYLGL